MELNALKKKEFCRVNSTATCFKVSHVTLDQHWARDKAMDKAGESQHLLTSTEKKALTKGTSRMAVTGYPPTQNLIYKMAHKLRQYPLIVINDIGI